MHEGKGDTAPLQDGVDNEQDTGDVGNSADEAGNPTDSADVAVPSSAHGVAEPEIFQPPGPAFSDLAQDRPQPSGTSSEQQQFLDADTHAKDSQEQQYPTDEGGGSNRAHEQNIHHEHQLDDTMGSKPQSPVGFSIEDDAADGQPEPGGAEGIESDGYRGRGIENNATHPISSQPPPRRYEDSSDNGNDGHKNAGIGSNKGSAYEANDDSGSRGRRMFDGSRVAEPDDTQIVDAGEGADIIPGVDDLPVFANDQSKALNDEIKVREGEFQQARTDGRLCPYFQVLVSTQSDTGELPNIPPQQGPFMTFVGTDTANSEKPQF